MIYLIRSIAGIFTLFFVVLFFPFALILYIIGYYCGWFQYVKNPTYYRGDLVWDMDKPKRKVEEQPDHIRICPVCEKLMDSPKCKDCKIETVLLEEWVDQQWNS